MGVCSLLWSAVPLNFFSYNNRSYGHAIQTLETDFCLSFDITNLQPPENWKFGDTEEFRLSVLCTDEASSEWNKYKQLLQHWLKSMITPWDEASTIYCYQRIRFMLQYLTEKYNVTQAAQSDFRERLRERVKTIGDICDSDHELDQE